MKHITKIAAAAAVLVLGTATAAGATVTLNPDGTGFVGKGDVQTLLELNNKEMQLLHKDITFQLQSSAQYSQDCEKEGKKFTQYKTFKKSVDVNTAIASESRKTGQWTGWNLLGFGGGSADEVPTDLCTPGVGEDGQSGWVPSEGSEVTQVEGSGSGGLYAIYAGNSYLLQ